MRRTIDLIAIVLFAGPVLALTAGKIGLQGYVTAFDKDKITVESGTQKVEVPRKFYSYKVKAGEKIVVELEQKDFDALVKTDLKAAPKK